MLNDLFLEVHGKNNVNESESVNLKKEEANMNTQMLNANESESANQQR